MINQSNENIRKRPSSSDKKSINYWDKLYEKGIKDKENHEREINEAKRIKQINEQQNYTFKPEINHNSRQLTKNFINEKAEDRLMMMGQIMQEKKEQQKTALDVEAKLKCTFHPELNRK